MFRSLFLELFQTQTFFLTIPFTISTSLDTKTWLVLQLRVFKTPGSIRVAWLKLNCILKAGNYYLIYKILVTFTDLYYDSVRSLISFFFSRSKGSNQLKGITFTMPAIIILQSTYPVFHFYLTTNLRKCSLLS